AAGAQQVASRAATDSQVSIELLLMDFVHMQQPVGGADSERGILNVVADYACTFLIAATKKISALMKVVMRFMGVVVWHVSLLFPRDGAERRLYASLSYSYGFRRNCTPRTLAES